MFNRIENILKNLENNPFDPTLDIRKLKGYKNRFRIRIGDCRIVYELDKKAREIKIIEISRREKVKY